MRSHDDRKHEDAAPSLGADAGIPGKRTRTQALPAGGGGGGAPILQFKPAGGEKPLAGGSFVDELLGGAMAGGENQRPAWMDPASNAPLPGDPVPGFGPGHVYTVADKDKLRTAYRARSKANRAGVGAFLREYVDAAVTIMGRYVKGSVKDKDQVHSFLKFVVAESLSTLAGGIGKKMAKEGMEFLASKVTDFGISAALEDDETFEDEKNLDRLIATIGGTTGALAEGMVTKMEDGFDAGMWLGAARVEDLHRFRVPELFVSPPREKIRGVVAGMVGGAHHRRVIGGQMGSGTQWMVVTDVQETDHNVIVVHVGVTSVGTAYVKSARINSRNKELAKEIDDKVDIGTLSAMALHVTVDPSGDRINPAARIMKAMTRGQASHDDVFAFEAAYPKNGPAFTYTRNTKHAFATEGEGSLADHLALYELATGDHDLSALADRFNAMEEDHDEKISRPGRRAPAELARLAYTAFKSTESAVTSAQALQARVVDKATPH